jgi:hypothetical protein
VEVSVAIIVLAVACLGIYGSLISASTLFGRAGEIETATLAAQTKIEELASVPYADLLTSYGEGKAKEYFDVPGLRSDKGRPEAGRVYFLRENKQGGSGNAQTQGVNTAFGTAFDLNADGDTNDLADPTFKAYPVAIEIRWQSQYGSRQSESRVFTTVISPKQQDGED